MYTGLVHVSVSSSSYSYFMVALHRHHFSPSLTKYVSKYKSNLSITSSDVDLCLMTFVLVLYFSGFILYISLRSLAILNTF